MDDTFGNFNVTDTETPSSFSAFHPHIDPSLQSVTTASYAAAPTSPELHQNVSFYAPHASNAERLLQALHTNLPTLQRVATATNTRARTVPQTPNTAGGQFGVLKLSYPETPLQRDVPASAGFSDGPESKKDIPHLQGMKKVLNPPDLEAWRDKLFNVNEIIYLTEDQMLTYWPWVDNIYSHRSTQQYKRKNWVTSYWDCRLKGRPPGTPKSTDPSKKKRKRVARERNLCDVKIKITEYLPGAAMVMADGKNASDKAQTDSFFAADGAFDTSGQAQAFADLVSGPGVTTNVIPGASGERFYSIQRVNGTGADGQEMGSSGGHKHDLAESDRIKKNSILREMAKTEKERKKLKKTHTRKATGLAAFTIKRHSKENELKFYGNSFCPFSQRVWIALEAKKMDYQYIEVDPHSKPKVLLDINSQGIVPALMHGQSFSCYESAVILQYLEDISPAISLAPATAAQRAIGAMWIEFINKSFVPAFHALVQAKDASAQIAKIAELRTSLNKLISAADIEGPYFSGMDLSLVDVNAAPHLLRLSRVLGPLVGWPDAEPGSRLSIWLSALESHPAVQATLSSPELYATSEDFGMEV